MSAASWGPRCSIVPRSKCETRRKAEEAGEAVRHIWYGFLWPVTYPMHKTQYSWLACPFCGGELREGIRSEILKEPKVQQNGSDEGEE